MTAPGYEGLPGKPLPEGSFTITAEDERLLLDVVGGEPSQDGTAHDLWAYVAPQRGIGIGIAELCALADFDVNDGPMLGSSRLEYHGPIRVGVPYRVTGEVIDIVRKQGSIGTFDILEFREDLLSGADELVASSTSTYILPRRAA
ncbi:MAG: hotdog family protein [Terriglobales bacterium]